MNTNKRYTFSWVPVVTSSTSPYICGIIIFYIWARFFCWSETSWVFLAGVMQTAFILLITVVSLYFKQRKIADVFSKGIVVSAEIIDTEFRSYGGKLHYRYDFNGIVCKSYCNVPRDWLKEHGRVGDIVDVIVDPDKPIEAYIADAYGDRLDNDGLIAAKLTPAKRKDNSSQE